METNSQTGKPTVQYSHEIDNKIQGIYKALWPKSMKKLSGLMGKNDSGFEQLRNELREALEGSINSYYSPRND